MIYNVRTVTVSTTLQQTDSNTMNSEDSLSDKGLDEVPLALAFSGVVWNQFCKGNACSQK